MKVAMFLLVLPLPVACGNWVAPPPPPERPPTPAPSYARALCGAYCDAVARCSPAEHYPECAEDCVDVLASPDKQAVSGITPALVSCWGEAIECAAACACDWQVL